MSNKNKQRSNFPPRSITVNTQEPVDKFAEEEVVVKTTTVVASDHAPVEDEREHESHPDEDQDHDETDYASDTTNGIANEEGAVDEGDGDDPVDEDKEGESTFDSTETDQPGIETVEDKQVFPFTPVAEWTEAELELYISRPENMDIYHSKLIEAIKTHRILKDTLPAAWSPDECTAFFQHGVVPEKTSKDVWVRDVTRKFRKESEWSTGELESWALKEIRSEGLVTENGLALEMHNRLEMKIASVNVEDVIAHYRTSQGLVNLKTPEPVTVKPTVVVAPVVESKPSIPKPGLNPMQQAYIEQTLKTYIEVTKPGSIVREDKAGIAIKALDNMYKAILAHPDPVAVNSGMELLMDTFKAHRVAGGTFDDTNIYRFVYLLLPADQENFRRYSTLLATCVDADRTILEQTDLEELSKHIPGDQKNLLSQFMAKYLRENVK